MSFNISACLVAPGEHGTPVVAYLDQTLTLGRERYLFLAYVGRETRSALVAFGVGVGYHGVIYDAVSCSDVALMVPDQHGLLKGFMINWCVELNGTEDVRPSDMIDLAASLKHGLGITIMGRGQV